MQAPNLHISEAEQFGVRLKLTFPSPDREVRWLQWSPDGETLISVHSSLQEVENETYFWNWRQAKPFLVLDSKETEFASSWDFAWSPDGTRIALGGVRLTDPVFPPGEDPDEWCSTGIEIRKVVDASRPIFIPVPAQYDGFDVIQWLPNSSLVAIAADDTFTLLDADSGQEVQSPEISLGGISALAIAPGGQSAIAVDGMGFIQLIDLATWSAAEAILAPNNLFTATWSPTGDFFAVTDQSGPILFYAPGEDVPLGQLVGHERGADRITFSFDGTLLSSIGRDSTLRIWKVSERRELARFSMGDRFGLTDWIFHPTEPLAAVWNDSEKRIEIWDIARLTGMVTDTERAGESALEGMDTLDEEFAAPEGREMLKVHLSRERNKILVARRKQLALEKEGCLRCEACGLVFSEIYGPLGEDFIECHHTRPVSTMKPEEETRLSDLSLVCSNCHRMLHRSPRLLTIGELRDLVNFGRGLSQ